MKKRSQPSSNNRNKIAGLFLLIPTIMLIIGYVLFPCSSNPPEHPLVYLPLFLGLLLLGIGVIWKEKSTGSNLKIAGWTLFAFFWSLHPCFLYIDGDGDIFNAAVCVIGVYVLLYIAYHEWLSIRGKETISCLNWIAGGTFIAGIIYFTIDSSLFPELKNGLIAVVADQSAGLLTFFGIEAQRHGDLILYNGVPVTIIFACTAIQAMVLFIGMIGALPSINLKRRLTALLVTVIPIYFLNLVRNASVIYLVGEKITSFNVAHNYMAKLGALITLIALLFITFKIVPELYDEIVCLFDLRKRKGPIEECVRSLLGKKAR